MSAFDESIAMARIAGQAAVDKLAANVVALDVSEQLVITDIFVVCSGESERQIASIVNNVEQEMHQHGYKARRREGDSDARWVLIDFTDIVVHVQHQEDREFYALERLWRDAPNIDLNLDDAPGKHEPQHA